MEGDNSRADKDGEREQQSQGGRGYKDRGRLKRERTAEPGK
jgi:hypothetical protein